MAEFTSTLPLRSTGRASVNLALSDTAYQGRVRSPSINFSNPIISQNETKTGSTTLNSNNFVVQEFFLPDDYARASVIPPLTGFQVYVGIDADCAQTASLEWYFHRYDATLGWCDLAYGVSVGSPVDGDEVWFDVYTDPVEIEPGWLGDRFRVGFRGRAASGQPLDTLVTSDGENVTISGTPVPLRSISPAPLDEGVVYPFYFGTTPSTLYVEPGSGNLYYNVQQGINKVWLVAPNPLATADVKAYQTDGLTALQSSSQDTSVNFRILAGVADEGVDFLGNVYRSALTQTAATNVGNIDDSFYLSKPNPSKFAVETLCFDVRTINGEATVIDRLLLDPLTPGVYVNVYYSNDDAPGVDEDTWNALLWISVPKYYCLDKRDEYALPHPITAKYVKLEFTHLQQRYYASGNFPKPMLYKKYPKWVVDYFLAVYQTQLYSESAANRIAITYDALDFAYNYYKDDILQSPSGPVVAPDSTSALTPFLDLQIADSVDTTTLTKIKLALQPYLNHPATLGRVGSLLSDYSLSTSSTLNYSVEQIVRDQGTPDEPASREVIIDKQYPVMFFYITARHGYREAYAKFEDDTAYFAGLKHVAFLRDKYDTNYDHDLYIESGGDETNVLSTDFESVGFQWMVY